MPKKNQPVSPAFVLLLMQNLLTHAVLANEASNPEVKLNNNGEETLKFIGAITVLWFIIKTTWNCFKTDEKKEVKPEVKPEEIIANIPAKGLDNVIGYQNIKEQFLSILQLLEKSSDNLPEGFIKPRVIMLSGPPGNGKTTLAEALASEGKRHFVKLSGGNIITKYQGSGSKSISEAFADVVKYPKSLIFIDEIDGFAIKRTDSSDHISETQALLTLLEKIDSVKADTHHDILIVFATNQAKKIDKALLSRCNLQITINDPDKMTRGLLIKKYAERFNCINNIELDRIVEQTAGFSVRRIEDAFTSSFQQAFSKDAVNPVITQQVIEEVLAGKSYGHPTHDKTYDPIQLKHTALHEAGHALVYYIMQEHGGTGTKLDSVTILSREEYKGCCFFSELNEGRHITKTERVNALAIGYGGAAAEMIDGEADITFGCESDYADVRKEAMNLVFHGMMRGYNTSFYQPVNKIDQLSDETKRRLEREVFLHTSAAFKQAKKIIKTHRTALEALQDLLLKEETVSGERVCEFLDTVITRSDCALNKAGSRH